MARSSVSCTVGARWWWPLSPASPLALPPRRAVDRGAGGSPPALPEPGGETARHGQALGALLLPPTSWARPRGKRSYFGDAGGAGRMEDLATLWLVVALPRPRTGGWEFLLLDACYQRLDAHDKPQLTGRWFVSSEFWMVSWNCIAVTLSCGFFRPAFPVKYSWLNRMIQVTWGALLLQGSGQHSQTHAVDIDSAIWSFLRIFFFSWWDPNFDLLTTRVLLEQYVLLIYLYLSSLNT